MIPTPEEIQQMPTGAALDRLVAEHIYGYEYLEIGYHQLPIKGLPQPPDGTSTPKRQMELNDWLDKPAVYEQYDGSVGEYFIMVASDLIIETRHLCPSQNISDAWKVVEAMQKRKYYSQHTDLSPDSGQQHWVWHFIPYNSGEAINGYGITAALAICRAALLTVLHSL